MSVEDQVYAHINDLRSPRWIAKKLKLCPAKVIEMVRRRDRQERKEAQSRNRVEKMISDARRSNLCVHQIDPVLREWGPKDPPKQAGRGNNFLPSGKVDRDFKKGTDFAFVGALG